jgi:hypothetical protein
MTNLRRYEIELDGLIWDSGYGEHDAVLNATVLWNVDTNEIDNIEYIYFGWVDQDGGDHETSSESYCEKVITEYIKSLPKEPEEAFETEEPDALRDERLCHED